MSSSEELTEVKPINGLTSSTSKPLTLQNITSDPIEASVLFTPDNPYHPINWPTSQKYMLCVAYCTLQAFVMLTSTTYISAEYTLEMKYGINPQTATLGQSMFILGTAIGPAFMGPLSDIGGRKWVYVGSTFLFTVFSIGCAWPKNYAMIVIFMLLLGITCSPALSNVAGSIGDLFGSSDDASQPMSLFVFSANAGPSIGGVVGEAIMENSKLGYEWLFIINIIIGGFFTVFLCFLPETLPRIVITERMSVEGKKVPNVIIREFHYFFSLFTGKKPSWAQVAPGSEKDEVENAVVVEKVNVLNEMRFIFVMAVKMMITEPIIIFLGLFNGFSYGLLFLYLDGIWDVFVINNELSPIIAECTYLNFVVGVTIVVCLIPVQTWWFKKDKMKRGGVGRPEGRLLISLVTSWGFPISLLWFAFTSDGKTNYWSPIIAGTVLGIADPLLWLAMLNYVIDSYSASGLSGSAVAAFSIPSFAIAAALSHAGVAMFENLSTKWGFAILGFVSIGVVVLVYALFFFGHRIRASSKLARFSVTEPQ